MLRAGTGNNIKPSFYFSWAMAGVTGGWITTGTSPTATRTIMDWDDPLIQEPGNMVGPTVQGIEDLIAKDPGAYWDTATNKVVQRRRPSPRVFPIPLYDPIYYDDGKTNGRDADSEVANWIGFFLEASRQRIYGRIIPICGIATRATGGPRVPRRPTV